MRLSERFRVEPGSHPKLRDLDAGFHENKKAAAAETARRKAADIAFGNLNSVEDFARHPQLRLGDTPTPSGAVSLPLSPLLPSSAALGAVPALGAHSIAIRAEFA